MKEEDFELPAGIDFSKFEEGEYLIIVDKKIVAYTKEDLKSALENVKKEYKGKMPLVVKVPSKETLILGFRMKIGEQE